MVQQPLRRSGVHCMRVCNGRTQDVAQRHLQLVRIEEQRLPAGQQAQGAALASSDTPCPGCGRRIKTCGCRCVPCSTLHSSTDAQLLRLWRPQEQDQSSQQSADRTDLSSTDFSSTPPTPAHHAKLSASCAPHSLAASPRTPCCNTKARPSRNGASSVPVLDSVRRVCRPAGTDPR